MKAKIILLAVFVTVISATLTGAQVIIELKPGVSEATQSNDDQGDDEIIREVFAPITDDLRLSPIQKFRISVSPGPRCSRQSLSSSSSMSWKLSSPWRPSLVNWMRPESNSLRRTNPLCLIKLSP